MFGSFVVHSTPESLIVRSDSCSFVKNSIALEISFSISSDSTNKKFFFSISGKEKMINNENIA